jgi:hypothetical protein
MVMLTATRRGDGLLLTAFALMVAASLYLLLAPTGTSESSTTTSDGTVVTETTHETLVESQGAGVVALLLIPPAIAAVPILAEQRRERPGVRIAVTTVMLVLCFLALLSIGIFYLPGTLALAAAAFRQ